MRLLSIALVLLFTAGVAQAECSPETVTIRDGETVLNFTVDVADTPRERSRGLMFVEDLPRQSGMLFVFDRPRAVTFWMKNTLIPLDMLFVDRTGVVRHIHHEAIPHDETQIEGGDSVFAVLEINGGLARRYSLTVGAELRHPVFSDGPAAWPC
ncbi:DUF192 domain-containing protein [Lutimaribacter marinistellae]|uniref:DUF192 domain-containing protein n=1 Tax=Lutimaribacter marinistellae TaxID=1820329 RepID=A0ABV7TMT9_9RHOB